MAPVEYKVIKNFYSQEELKILQSYCYIRVDQNKDFLVDPQSFSPAFYNDPLMGSILDTKLPMVESHSNLKLFPSYSYWRYYVFGGTLAQHTDRPSCEISVTSCIKKYDNWPLIIEGEEIELEEGDGLLYSGCIQKHGRPGMYTGEGMAQAFFHYVDQNGPFKHHAYDNYFKENNTGLSEEDMLILKSL